MIVTTGGSTWTEAGLRPGARAPFVRRTTGTVRAATMEMAGGCVEGALARRAVVALMVTQNQRKMARRTAPTLSERFL
jgi:hypothetical protein